MATSIEQNGVRFPDSTLQATAVILSNAIDSESETTGASSKAVKDAIAAAIGGSGSASATYHAIGSYAFASRAGSATSVSPNNTIAGSQLRMCGALAMAENGVSASISMISGNSLPGTWRCMGLYNKVNTVVVEGTTEGEGYAGTLWVRIS